MNCSMCRRLNELDDSRQMQIELLCRARDEETGEVPVAFVVARHGNRVSEAELIDYIAKQV